MYEIFIRYVYNITFLVITIMFLGMEFRINLWQKIVWSQNWGLK